jgi:hypothetical protein
LDAAELEYIQYVNGFDIRYNENSDYKYIVFHPSYNGIFIDEFVTLSEAIDFCNEEDADEWEQEIRSNY